MPGLDGIQFVKKFKECQPDVKVIAMTGYYAAYEKEIRQAEAANLLDGIIRNRFHLSSLKT